MNGETDDVAAPEVPAARREPAVRRLFRGLAAVLFVGAGLNHFRNPGFYVSIIPPSFPSPRLLVFVSGVAEIAGGLGLLVRPLRRAAGWGLIVLLIAVFPANVYMALQPERFRLPPWLAWVRLPLQGVLMAWVWWVALARTVKAERLPTGRHGS